MDVQNAIGNSSENQEDFTPQIEQNLDELKFSCSHSLESSQINSEAVDHPERLNTHDQPSKTHKRDSVESEGLRSDEQSDGEATRRATKTDDSRDLYLIHEVYSSRSCKQFGGLELGQRIARYEKHLKRSKKTMQVLEQIGQKERSMKLAHCGSYQVWREWCESGKIQIRECKFCQQTRLCDWCAYADCQRQVRGYLPKVTHLMKTQDLVPVMVTLTVKNGNDLKERTDHLFSSLTKQHHRIKNYWRGDGNSIELGKCAGGLWCVEITHSQEKGWHPHAHGLIMRPADHAFKFDPRKISEQWHQITGDSYIIDVRMSEAGKHYLDCKSKGIEPDYDTVFKDLCEMIKYPLKPGGLTPAARVHAWQTLQRKQLRRPFGCLYGVDIPDMVDTNQEEGSFFEDYMQREGGTLVKKASCFGTVVDGKEQKSPWVRVEDLDLSDIDIDDEESEI